MTLVYLQLFLQGLATGALYGVVALGMQLILGSTGKVHLGVGQIAVLSALTSVSLAGGHGLALPWAALGGGFLAGFFSYLLHPPGLWRLLSSEQGERVFLLLTLGGSLGLEAVAQWIWPLPVTALSERTRMFQVAGIPLFSNTKALAFLLCLALSLALLGLLGFTRKGKALRAWNMGCEELRLVGVDPQSLGRWVSSVGLGIVGLGGVLLGATQVVSPQDALGYTMRALCLAVLGGGLRPLRTMGFGWAMGVGEAAVSHWLGAQWHPVLAPGLLLVVLCSRRKLLG